MLVKEEAFFSASTSALLFRIFNSWKYFKISGLKNNCCFTCMSLALIVTWGNLQASPLAKGLSRLTVCSSRLILTKRITAVSYAFCFLSSCKNLARTWILFLDRSPWPHNLSSLYIPGIRPWCRKLWSMNFRLWNEVIITNSTLENQTSPSPSW